MLIDRSEVESWSKTFANAYVCRVESRDEIRRQETPKERVERFWNASRAVSTSDDRGTRWWRLQSARQATRIESRCPSGEQRLLVYPGDPFRGLHLPDGTTASYQPYSSRTGSNTLATVRLLAEKELLPALSLNLSISVRCDRVYIHTGRRRLGIRSGYLPGLCGAIRQI